jgi:putative PIN family toxin of toxin-antitoxin system
LRLLENRGMKKTKIILDTNLWISFLISKKLDNFDKLIENKKIILIFSTELLDEFNEVVTRPKFKQYFSKKDIDKLFEYFNQFGELTAVISNIDICRGKKDNFLLNLALDSKADYLITGDKDLLILRNFEKTKIIAFADFINQIK